MHHHARKQISRDEFIDERKRWSSLSHSREFVPVKIRECVGYVTRDIRSWIVICGKVWRGKSTGKTVGNGHRSKEENRRGARRMTATCWSIDARWDVLETGERSSPTRSLPLPLPLYVTFSRERFNVNNPTRPRPPLRYRFSAINRVDGKSSGLGALLITTPRQCRSS